MPGRSCSVAGCDAEHNARGLCRRHYARAKARDQLPPASLEFHIVTNVSPDGSTGDCSLCGQGIPVKVRSDRVRCWFQWRRERDALNALGRRITAEGGEELRKRNAYAADYARRKKYGLPPGGVADLLRRANYACEICTEPVDHSSAHIDHDHSCCGRDRACAKCVRGVLCAGCNYGLGNFRDDPARLKSAIEYLSR